MKLSKAYFGLIRNLLKPKILIAVVVLAIFIVLVLLVLIPVYWEGALWKSVNNGDYEAIDTILERYPHLVTSKDQYGETPLHIAVSRNDVACVAVLVKRGGDMYALSATKGSAINLAAAVGNAEVIRELCASAVDLDQQTGGEVPYGGAPLHIACVEGNSAAVKILLEYGANVNAKNRFRGDYTPLHELIDSQANAGKRKKIGALLLEYGADRNAVDVFGKTALDYCYEGIKVTRDVCDFIKDYQQQTN